MRLDRSAALLCARLIRSVSPRDATDSISILMYHNVSAVDESRVRPYYRLATSPERFREQMRLIAESGLVATSLPEALATSTAKNAFAQRVVLTFDDGYLDFLLNAWPILEQFGFTASVFLPTRFIADNRRSFKGRQCLTWSEVKDLSRRGISFGSHTVTHPLLQNLPWAQVCSELSSSREEISRAIGDTVTTFAYPYAFPQNDAAFVSRFCAELRRQGYRAAVTTMIGRVAAGDDPLRLRRLPVNDADDLQLFAAKLAGAYDWVGTLQVAAKRLRGGRQRAAEAGLL